MCSLRCLADTLLAGFDFLVFKALILLCISVKLLSLNKKVDYNSMAVIINILGCLQNLSNIESRGSFKFSCEVMNSLGSLIPRDETAYSKYVFNVSCDFML